jgi:hypothetical protein
MIHCTWEPDPGKRVKPHPGLNILLFPWSNPHHPIFTCVRTDDQVFNQCITQSDTLWGSDKKMQVMPEWNLVNVKNVPSSHSMCFFFGGRIVGLGVMADFYHNIPNGLWFIKCSQKHLERTIFFLVDIDFENS